MQKIVKSKILLVLVTLLAIVMVFNGCTAHAANGDSNESYDSCSSSTRQDQKKTIEIGNKLAKAQPTPTDIEFSATRYLLIKRAYILNGLKEKADALPCPIDLPIGYLYLYLEGIGLVDIVLIEGAPVSLNTFLSADSEYYGAGVTNYWLPDVDGTYGENEDGIFFFLPDGSFREWNAKYYYSDTLLKTDSTINYQEEGK